MIDTFAYCVTISLSVVYILCLVQCLKAKSLNGLFWIYTIVYCLTILSYAIVIIRTPGLATFRQFTFEVPVSLDTALKRWCSKCMIVKPKMVKHCHYCDVCFENWDHHCPWTTKCVAGRNLVIFYIFLCGVVAFLILSMSMVMNIVSKDDENSGF